MAKNTVTQTRATPNTDANKAAVGTKKHLLENMQPVDIVINGIPMIASAREFQTGNIGYNANGKITIKLADGSAVTCQLGVNITVIGSKSLPKG